MLELSTAIMISSGWLVYYLIFQLFDDILRAGSKTNTPNSILTGLRTEYKVNIRTFQKNNNLSGFAWFKSIWLNENLYKRKKLLLFTFHHEYYHLKHKHKQLLLLSRFILSIEWVMLAFVPWWIVVIIISGSALFIENMRRKFEDKANEYAKSKINES